MERRWYTSYVPYIDQWLYRFFSIAYSVNVPVHDHGIERHVAALIHPPAGSHRPGAARQLTRLRDPPLHRVKGNSRLLQHIPRWNGNKIEKIGNKNLQCDAYQNSIMGHLKHFVYEIDEIPHFINCPQCESPKPPLDSIMNYSLNNGLYYTKWAIHTCYLTNFCMDSLQKFNNGLCTHLLRLRRLKSLINRRCEWTLNWK